MNINPSQSETLKTLSSSLRRIAEGSALDDFDLSVLNALKVAQAPDDLLTPEETARKLGVAKETLEVWRSVNRYDIPFVKVGAKVMYQRSAINEFIRKRTYTAVGTPVEVSK